ncbi:MAG: isochorismate synthase [Flavobacteriaceae bacterium]
MQDFIASLLAQHRPFVLFRFPGQAGMHCYYQHDQAAHYTQDYSEEGFVFAPFVAQAQQLYIPATHQKDFSLVKATPSSSIKLPLSGKAAFVEKVAAAVEAIAFTSLEKVVLSNAFSLPYNGEAIEVFTRLLTHYPNAFVSYWFHPKTGQWLGASPEQLIALDEGQLSTVALAGTLGRDATALDWTDKELHEQQLVVESIVDELRQSGAVHKLKIGERTTIKAGQLYHLQTPIRASLESKKLPTLVQALHPTPAVGGFPKTTAIRYINNKEGYDRAYYTGFLGPFSKGTTANLFVNLRCGKITPQQLTLFTGAGITAGSIPVNEWDEICRKASTFLAAL